MGVPMINKCCFCASLHMGTLIIGYVYSVWALIEITLYCLLVTLAPLGKDGTVSVHKYVLYTTAAVVSGTHLVCSVLLVVAAYKKLASLTLPWTIVTGIITAIYFLLSFTGVSLVLQDEGEMLKVEAIVIFIHLARACLCSDDLIAAYVNVKSGTGRLIVCSAYLDGTKTDPSEELAKVVEYAYANNAELLIGCDANAHHTNWGSTDINDRVVSVYCIIVVHSRHKQIMHAEDEKKFQHSARLYHPVKMEDHVL